MSQCSMTDTMRRKQSKEDATVFAKQRDKRGELHEIAGDEIGVWSCIGDGPR